PGVSLLIFRDEFFGEKTSPCFFHKLGGLELRGPSFKILVPVQRQSPNWEYIWYGRDVEERYAEGVCCIKKYSKCPDFEDADLLSRDRVASKRDRSERQSVPPPTEHACSPWFSTIYPFLLVEKLTLTDIQDDFHILVAW
ncbi:3190_t:CDS:2, partial [Acaulospora colombiana]